MTTRIGQLAAGNRKKLKPVLGALCAVLFALCSSTEAQQPKKFARIGYLSPSDPASESARSEAIRLALSELGYIEGQNIATEYRYAERERRIVFPRYWPSWCVSTSTSLWCREEPG